MILWVTIAAVLLMALTIAYLYLRLRRLERIESEHFAYVDGRVDELAEAVYERLAAADHRLDVLTDRLTRAEAAAQADHLLHLTAAAHRRGELAEPERRALEKEWLSWREEARSAAAERSPS